MNIVKSYADDYCPLATHADDFLNRLRHAQYIEIRHDNNSMSITFHEIGE